LSSETSVDNHFTRQYNPEDNSEEKSCLSIRGSYRNKGHNSEELSWVLITVKMVTVALKLNMAIEQPQEQGLFVSAEDTNRTKVTVLTIFNDRPMCLIII
jgi:hypothetical protein